jgi:hypothetical protein
MNHFLDSRLRGHDGNGEKEGGIRLARARAKVFGV